MLSTPVMNAAVHPQLADPQGDALWPRHLAALRAREAGADLLPPVPEEVPEFTRVRLLAGAYPILRVQGEQGGQITLHSPRRPWEEAAELARGAPLGRGGAIVALGLWLGYHLMALLPLLSPAEDLVVVEPEPEVFWAALSAVDLSPLLTHPRTRLVVGQDLHKAVGWLQRCLGLKKGKKAFFFGHPPSLRAVPGYYREVVSALRPSSRPAAAPRGIKKERLRVLVVNPDYFLIPEVLRAFGLLGHQAELILFDKRREAGEAVLQRILRQIGEAPPDLVFTVNHLGFDREGVLLAALERLAIPSVSWYVDSPAIILSLYDGPRSELAYIFVWDPTYIPEVRALGFQRVFPLPLATDPEIFRPAAARPESPAAGRVVFVGNSMVGSVQQKLSRLPGGPEFQELFQRLCQGFRERPFRRLGKLLAELGLQAHPLIRSLDRQGRSELEAALLWSTTQSYRLEGVKALAPFAPVIFGDPGWRELLAEPFVLAPELHYYDDLPGVYASAAVNFNATSLQMKAAVNQRVFDVPAAGGFLVTDFREQLAELFSLEEEVVCFREPAEIPEMVRFYLGRPDLREKVAQRARARVLASHTYRHRVAAMLDILRRTL